MVLTDNWTVFGSFGREWAKANHNSNHIKTDSWSLGTSYNIINDGKNFLQGAFDYAQSKHHNSGWGKTGKSYTVTGMYGYNFDAVTPYVKVSYWNSANKGPKNDATFTTTVAAYKKLADKVGSTLGVAYAHQTSSAYKNSYTLQADTSYMFTDNVALKVFADYLLDQKVKDTPIHGSRYYKTNNRYTIGADLKVAF